MTHKEALIYTRVSSTTQDYQRQIDNLKDVANSRGWNVKRVFAEKISGTTNANKRSEFNALLKYAGDKKIKLLLISEISRLGRKVVDVLTTIEELHNNGIALYVQQFNMVSLNEDGKENMAVKMLMQMLSIGAEMSNNARLESQRQGIQIAKMKGTYTGRKNGATATPEKVLTKYEDVADLIRSSKLSLRRIATITNRSINTVRKVNAIL